jgi:hypothetical protein
LEVRVFNYGTESCECEVVEVWLKGFPGQFLFNHVKPVSVSSFDYVMLILDDIELSSEFNMDRIVRNLDGHNLDVLSPMISSSSKSFWNYMVQPADCGQDIIRRVKAIEFFCYIFSRRSYAKYHCLLDEETAWMWGIDFAMHKHGIEMGMLEGVTMLHHIKGESYGAPGAPDAKAEFMRNIARLGTIIRERSPVWRSNLEEDLCREIVPLTYLKINSIKGRYGGTIVIAIDALPAAFDFY